MIYLGTNGLLRDIPVNKVKAFEGDFLTTLEQKFPAVLDNFRKGKLEDSDLASVKALAAEVANLYK
jgi:F-type H+-transporting ATPase subunit alpha